MQLKNNLSKQSQKPKFSMVLQQGAIQNLINNTLGDHKKAQKFVTAISSAVATNQVLQECDSYSIINAALLGETLNLSPSPQLGHYYMVPFDDKEKGKVATFQLGYKGYLQLAIRSGQYKRINVVAVKEGELIEYNPFDEVINVHPINDELEREKAKTIGYYAMFELVNGFRKSMYWSKDKMLCHADKYSQAFSKDATNKIKYGKTFTVVSFEDYENGNYDKKTEWLYSSFWYKDFDGMAYKTMLRQLISKWGIMSIELQSAFENDMTFKDESGNASYVEEVEENKFQTVTEDIQVVEVPEEKESQQQITQPQPQEQEDEQPTLL